MAISNAKTAKANTTTRTMVKAVAAVTAVIATVTLVINRPTPGLAYVKTPRGTEWAQIEFDGPTPDLHLGEGVPLIDHSIAAPRNANGMVVWMLHETTPYAVTYAVEGTIHKESHGPTPVGQSPMP